MNQAQQSHLIVSELQRLVSMPGMDHQRMNEIMSVCYASIMGILPKGCMQRSVSDDSEEVDLMQLAALGALAYHLQKNN